MDDCKKGGLIMSNAKILAEKVMGTPLDLWAEKSRAFDPENNDSDLMMCWDRFVEKKGGDWLYKNIPHSLLLCSGSIRRTAMVDCMVKAVTA